jgi:hypothetical protein
VLGAVLAVALLVQLHLNQVDLGAAALEFDRAGVRSVIKVVAALAAGSTLLEIVGFRVSMLLLLGYRELHANAAKYTEWARKRQAK